jgi:hypothetical protein
MSALSSDPGHDLDLKWLTTTAKASESGAPSALKACASGSRALANAADPRSTREGPTVRTVSGLKMNAVRMTSWSASGGRRPGDTT